jgi:flagellar motility protein MotE (MotC chaperone)
VVLSVLWGTEADSAQAEQAPAAAASPTPNAEEPQAHKEVKVEEKKTEERPAAHEPESYSSEACLVDPVVLADIRKAREELEAKAKRLADKEAELKARERAMEEELKKIQEVRDDVTKMEALHKEEAEEKVNKLVETFETMNPKSVAQVLVSVDERLAVAAASKISTAKLAKVMNLMEPSRSSRLSELLAGIVHARTSTIASAKGGEKNDRSSESGAESAKSEPSKQKE